MSDPIAAPASTRAEARVIGAAALGAGLAAFACGFLAPEQRRIAAFLGAALPIVLANLALVVVAALAVARASVRAGFRPRGDDLAAAAALALVVLGIALLVPGRMRIQADEYLIAGSAFGIWLDGTPQVLSAALFDPGGAIAPLHFAPDKRGLLLPLLLALSEGRGASAWAHGFVLNASFGWAALLGVYALLRQGLRPAPALAGALVLAASPVFAFACRSILLEPSNLALLAWTALVAARAVRTGRVDLAVLLGLLAPLLAQARYESALVAAPAYALSVWLLVRARRRGAALAVALVVPLLFLPFAWQRAIVFEHGLELIGASEPFAARYALANGVEALRFFALPSQLNPLAPVVLVFAAIGVVSCARRMPAMAAPDRAVLGGIAGAILAMFAVVLCYAWGDLLESVTARLGLPAIALGCAAFGAGVDRAFGRLRHGGALAIASAGVVLALSLPSMRAEWLFDGGGQIGRPLDRAVEWLRAGYPGCRPLLVTAYGPYFVVNGYSATGADRLASDGPRLFAHVARTRGTVLWIQLVDALGQPLNGNAIDPRVAGRLVLDEPGEGVNGLRVLELRRADDATQPIAGCP